MADGGMMRLPLADYMRQLEASRGLPAGYLSRTRQIESSGGKNTVNPNSSARGDFQFIKSTAAKYGVNVNDPYDSARGAADLARDNAAFFQKRLGATPTGADLYGMHQQGAGGYVNLTRGIAPGGDAQALNGGAGMNAAQFRDKLAALYNRAPTPPAVAPSPGANMGQGPTIQAAAALPPAPPDPAQGTYTGGLLGLLQGNDYTGAGSAKDTMGKLGDLTNSKAFGGAMQGLAGALAPAQAPRPMQLMPVDPNDEVRPQMSLLGVLGRRGMGV